MFGLWKNEMRFFFSRRSWLIFLATIFAVPVVFYFSYFPQYEEYKYEKLQDISNQQMDETTYIKMYENKILLYEENDPEYEKLPELREMLEIWKAYSAESNLLSQYWEEPKDWEEEIRSLTRQMDTLLLDAPKEADLAGENLYRQTERDWNQRMLLYDAYDEAEVEVPINEKEPTGAYALYQALSGFHPIFLLLLILLIFWNYDCWSTEFDAGTYRLLYIQPYSRGNLFGLRSLVHWFFSMIGCVVVLLEVYLCGAICCGSGWKNFVIVNTDILKTFGRISAEDGALLKSDVVITMGQAVLLRFALAFLFLTFFYVVVQFFSFLWKNGMLSMITVMVLVILVFSTNVMGQDKIQSVLPVYYFRMDQFLSGEMQIGIPLYLLIEIVWIAVAWMGSWIWMKHRNL